MNIRSKFLIPNSLYFLNHSVGCLPRNSRLATERFFCSWQNFGGEAWDSWFETIEQFKNNLAKLINANAPSEICPQNNVSASITKIINSLPKRHSRKKILISESAFPSIGFASQMAAQNNYELEFVSIDSIYENILSNWSQKLNDDVQLVILTHVLSNNSLLYPVKKLIEIAKEKNIYTVVDVAASIGIKPIDVSEWGADFVVGTCLKWLCGGSGTGFLWANQKKIAEFQPTDVGWFSHLDPSELNIHHFEYAVDARRFWGGTPSILPFIIANESIKLLLEIGLTQVFAQNNLLIDKLLDAFQVLNVKINSPLQQKCRGGTVVIELDDIVRAKTYFSDKGLWIDLRDQGFRISPHVYNELYEIEKIIEIMEDLYYKKVNVILPKEIRFRRYGQV